jgi:excisionase family DNA binding protein
MGRKQVQRDVGEPLMLTYTEAAAKIGVSLSRVYRLLREGEIHNVPTGPRERRIPLSECEAYVDRLVAEHIGEAS